MLPVNTSSISLCTWGFPSSAGLPAAWRPSRQEKQSESYQRGKLLSTAGFQVRGAQNDFEVRSGLIASPRAMSSKRGVRFVGSDPRENSNVSGDGLGGAADHGSQPHSSRDDDDHAHTGAMSDASFSLKSVWFSDMDVYTDRSASDASDSDADVRGARRHSRGRSRSHSRAKSLSEVGSLGGLSLYFSDMDGNSEGGFELSPRSGIDSIGSGWAHVFSLHPATPTPMQHHVVTADPLPVARVRHVPRAGVTVGGGAVVRPSGAGVCAVVNRYTHGVDVQQWRAVCGVADRSGIICSQPRLMCHVHTHLRTSAAQLAFLKSRRSDVASALSERAADRSGPGTASVVDSTSKGIHGGEYAAAGFATVGGVSRRRQASKHSLEQDLDAVRAAKVIALEQVRYGIPACVRVLQWAATHSMLRACSGLSFRRG